MKSSRLESRTLLLSRLLPATKTKGQARPFRRVGCTGQIPDVAPVKPPDITVTKKHIQIALENEYNNAIQMFDT